MFRVIGTEEETGRDGAGEVSTGERELGAQDMSCCYQMTCTTRWSVPALSFFDQLEPE